MNEESIDHFLREIKFEHDFIVVQSDINGTLIRTSMNKPEDGVEFVNLIQENTNTTFISRKTMPNLVRLVFHKKWVCQHSTFNKKLNSKRNADCGAFIDIKIKKITRNTIHSDGFINRATPLPCIIKMNLQHSHCNDSTMLKVKEEVKKQFQNYFNAGMTVSEARQLHETKIIAELEHGYEKVADASSNPTSSQVHYLFKKWKFEKNGPPSDPFSKLLENLPKYESKGDKCPQREFCLPFHDDVNDEKVLKEYTSEISDEKETLSAEIDLISENLQNTVQDASFLESDIKNVSSNIGKVALLKEFDRIINLEAEDANYQILARCFSNIRKKEDFREIACMLSKSMCKLSKYKKIIKVQPTSITRRRPGLSRGAVRVFPGRSKVNADKIKKKYKKYL